MLYGKWACVSDSDRVRVCMCVVHISGHIGRHVSVCGFIAWVCTSVSVSVTLCMYVDMYGCVGVLIRECVRVDRLDIHLTQQ